MANKPSAEELKKNLSEMQFYVTQNHGQSRHLRVVYCITSVTAYITV
ncbi:methionine sulfoxide reductase B [Escherichia coli]|nr:methionine sulfoxide reductase B [Escherichia coli]